MSEKKHKKVGHGHKGEPEKDQSEVRWLISYSDFMMQLVCLFILLFSVSTVDQGRLEAIAEGYREAKGLPPPLVTYSPEEKAPPLTQAQIPLTVRQIQIELGRFRDGQFIHVIPTADGFKLQLHYPMFAEGSGLLNRDGELILEVASVILRPYEPKVGQIDIVGHTAADDKEAEGDSALRLSLTRAREAFRYVSRAEAPHRLTAAKLTAAGRGPHDPVAESTNRNPRQLNRRVDFVVHLIRPPKS